MSERINKGGLNCCAREGGLDEHVGYLVDENGVIVDCTRLPQAGIEYRKI